MIDTIPWARDLASVVGEHGPRIAVHDGTNALTFTAMAGRASRLAMILRQAGVAHGEPVASSLRNSIDAVWASVGLRIAGVAETPLNASYSDEEKAYCIGIAGVRRVVTTKAQAKTFQALGCEVFLVEDHQVIPFAHDLCAGGGCFVLPFGQRHCGGGDGGLGF